MNFVIIMLLIMLVLSIVIPIMIVRSKKLGEPKIIEKMDTRKEGFWISIIDKLINIILVLMFFVSMIVCAYICDDEIDMLPLGIIVAVIIMAISCLIFASTKVFLGMAKNIKKIRENSDWYVENKRINAKKDDEIK